MAKLSTKVNNNLIGVSGYSGTSGYSGFSGTSGYSGFIGTSGYSGTSANVTASAISGALGYAPQTPLISGENIKTINSASILGSGNLKVTPTWTLKQSDATIASGDYVFVDTSSNAITITLPNTPALSDTVKIVDYAGTFLTNNCTISRNGSKIMSISEDMVISTNNASVQLTYINSTIGWKIN